MKNNLLICLLLAAVTIAVYWQTGDQTFTRFDDNAYVEKNPHVVTGLTGANIVWAFTTTHAANWHPLTWLSHMADCQLYGLDPRGHHRTNVIIHALTTLLLFLLLVRITGGRWQSFLVAALFALHPLHVESVAWISERKDLLSGLLWMLTLLAYARYVKYADRRFYLVTLLLFVAGLMAKPMLVTLPLVLLCLDYWPLGRLGTNGHHLDSGYGETRRTSVQQLLLEKLPFLLFSAASALITVYAQKAEHAVVPLRKITVALRLENAVVAYVNYALKMIVPRDLAIFYPFREYPLWQVVVCLILLMSVSLLAWRFRDRAPYLAVGWLWYLVTLLPVIGLVQVGYQSMADRYTYLPLIGLFIIVAWGISDLVGSGSYRTIVLGLVAATIIAGGALLTNHQLSYWKTDTGLFTHALAVTTDNYKAHHSLGVVLARQGNFEEAFRHFAEAIRIVPGVVYPYYDLGVALEASGRPVEAAALYRKVISLNPRYVEAHTQLGGILCREGEFSAAFSHFSTALQINPGYAPARSDRENCLKIAPR